MSSTQDDIPLDVLTNLCACPTAAFVEDRPLAYVDDFAKRHKKVRAQTDRWGNRLLTLPGREPERPRLILVAHLDHPGLVSAEMIGPDTLAAELRGGVKPEFLPGTKVRFFDGDREVRGTIESTGDHDRDGTKSVAVRVQGDVPPNCCGMFDLTPGRLTKTTFVGRACDDLAGAAAALTALRQLHGRRGKLPGGDFGVLLTRGEEVGFVGALAAVTGRPSLLKKSDALVSVECSAEQPAAPFGKGVVLRVGDKSTVFDSALTRFMDLQAAALAGEGDGFAYNRALMPGGSCEATALNAFGHRAAGACVPLRNYHNMDRQKKKIAAESIHLDDWRNMVRLFARLAEKQAEFDPNQADLKKRLRARLAAYKPLLKA